MERGGVKTDCGVPVIGSGHARWDIATERSMPGPARIKGALAACILAVAAFLCGGSKVANAGSSRPEEVPVAVTKCSSGEEPREEPTPGVAAGDKKVAGDKTETDKGDKGVEVADGAKAEGRDADTSHASSTIPTEEEIEQLVEELQGIREQLEDVREEIGKAINIREALKGLLASIEKDLRGASGSVEERMKRMEEIREEAKKIEEEVAGLLGADEAKDGDKSAKADAKGDKKEEKSAEEEDGKSRLWNWVQTFSFAIFGGFVGFVGFVLGRIIRSQIERRKEEEPILEIGGDLLGDSTSPVEHEAPVTTPPPSEPKSQVDEGDVHEAVATAVKSDLTNMTREITTAISEAITEAISPIIKMMSTLMANLNEALAELKQELKQLREEVEELRRRSTKDEGVAEEGGEKELEEAPAPREEAEQGVKPEGDSPQGGQATQVEELAGGEEMEEASVENSEGDEPAEASKPEEAGDDVSMPTAEEQQEKGRSQTGSMEGTEGGWAAD